MYSNTSQTRGSKLAKFSNLRFRSQSLLFTFKLRYLLLYKVAPKFAIPGHFLSPKNREFGGITVFVFFMSMLKDFPNLMRLSDVELSTKWAQFY